MVHGKEIAFVACHYGYDSQSRQLIEEMAELTQAINKFWRKQLDCGEKELKDIPFVTPDEAHIWEEIADVEFCIDQIKTLMQCESKVEMIKRDKIQRQLLRIKQENNT